MLRIEDNGCGIEPGHLPRLTEPYYRVDLNSQGAGLGICIAAQIIQRCGGSLEIHSEPGRGTQVDCCFPQIRLG